MTSSMPEETTPAPRAVILLPAAFLLHLAEEWFGGLPAWTLTAPGFDIAPERFLLINAIAFPLFTIGSLAAFRDQRAAWLGASIAALLGLNGVLHSLATLGLGYYMPGTVTGLLLYIPLSFVVLRSLSTRLSAAVFAGAVLFGVLLHGLVPFLASI